MAWHWSGQSSCSSWSSQLWPSESRRATLLRPLYSPTWSLMAARACFAAASSVFCLFHLFASENHWGHRLCLSSILLRGPLLPQIYCIYLDAPIQNLQTESTHPLHLTTNRRHLQANWKTIWHPVWLLCPNQCYPGQVWCWGLYRAVYYHASRSEPSFGRLARGRVLSPSWSFGRGHPVSYCFQLTVRLVPPLIPSLARPTARLSYARWGNCWRSECWWGWVHLWGCWMFCRTQSPA